MLIQNIATALSGWCKKIFLQLATDFDEVFSIYPLLTNYRLICECWDSHTISDTQNSGQLPDLQ